MTDLLRFLSEQYAMHLATSGSQGPHAATVFFALGTEPFRLLFLSARETRHIQEILRDPRAAATIAAPSHDVSRMCGAQLWGQVRAPRDPVACLVQYLGKFREADRYLPKEVYSHLWEFRVARARWIDNSLGLGHRREWSCLDGV